MARRFLSCLLCFVLAAAALSAFAGCASRAIAATDLMEGIHPNESADSSDETKAPEGATSEEQADALADFAVTLFQNSRSDGVTLISPLSVSYALGMTANGARGETLSQMEQVLGMPIDQLNESLHAYAEALPHDDDCKMSVANSLWVKQGLNVDQGFLKTNAAWYDAGVFEAPFDETTVADINQWTSQNTDGMIDSILDQIPADAVMYLTNAIAFDATWQHPYESGQIINGTFTTQEGTGQAAEFMQSDEDLYLESANAVGFVKPYSNPSYAFAALLPNQGTSVDDLIESLDGASLRTMLEDAHYATVDAKLPKFEIESQTNMAETLAAMGMTDAFDRETADFTGISTEENLFISRILHKAYINVDEKGTKAAAVTSTEMTGTSAMIEPEEVKTVHLDRPFVYLLIDRQTNLPLFMGVIESMEG